MTKLINNDTFRQSTIDLLVGGTPCQSFSVAGLRGGLADPRGNLMLTFLGLADAKKPRWIVWENVPGVLSSNGGKDFGTFLGALGELGYGFAYRVLDAQYFGVAQRRRRVFVVGYLGDWRPAAAVLFERESLSGHTKPSRKKRQETAAGAEGGAGATSDVSCAGGNVSPCVTSKWKTGYGGPSGSNETGNMVYQQVAQPVHAFKVRQGCDGGGKGYLGQDEKAFTISTAQDQQIAQPKYFESHPNDSRVTGPHDVGNTVSARYGTGGGNTPIVAQPIAVDTYNQTINEKTTQTIGASASDVDSYGAVLQPTIIDRAAFNQGKNAQYEPRIEEGQTMSSLVAKGPHAVQHTMAIRRLTPRECERLQGFPDDWTLIPYRNKPADQCPDGPRYKACGNSMAVPVMRWIGQRIKLIDTIIN